MSDKVFIKGNKYGLKINIDEDVDILSAYDELRDKLIAGRKFFGESKVSLELDYKHKNEGVEKRIVDIIESNSELKVFCIIDDDMEVAVPSDIEEMRELASKKEPDIIRPDIESVSDDDALLPAFDTNKIELEDDVEYAKFFQGTLRSGQQLKSVHSIVFLGDVNPGAKIISTGNILVLGSMRGFAHAGATGKREASIFAVDLKPTQLRIAEFIARAPKTYEASETSIAFVEDDRIVIDKIDKGLLKDFVLLK